MTGNSDWYTFETETETVEIARFSLANCTPRGGRFLASLERNEKQISVLRGRLTSPKACCAMLRAQVSACCACEIVQKYILLACCVFVLCCLFRFNRFASIYCTCFFLAFVMSVFASLFRPVFCIQPTIYPRYACCLGKLNVLPYRSAGALFFLGHFLLS